MYIKKKAELYAVMDERYFAKEQRVKAVEEHTQFELFRLVDWCLTIQKHINEINSKYKGKNRSVDLIQMVFTMLLKTYLLCYSLVSTCARLLFSR